MLPPRPPLPPLPANRSVPIAGLMPACIPGTSPILPVSPCPLLPAGPVAGAAHSSPDRLLQRAALVSPTGGGGAAWGSGGQRHTAGRRSRCGRRAGGGLAGRRWAPQQHGRAMTAGGPWRRSSEERMRGRALYSRGPSIICRRECENVQGAVKLVHRDRKGGEAYRAGQSSTGVRTYTGGGGGHTCGRVKNGCCKHTAVGAMGEA